MTEKFGNSVTFYYLCIRNAQHDAERQETLFFMAKITNMVGLAKGKTGAIVYSVRNGQQIARAYNPYVGNPNTPAQVQSRAKLKLLSQVSAAVAPVIAIPRRGAQSPRNLFTKVNYKYTSYAASVANLKLADMQLTDSAVGLEGFIADRTSGTAIHCELQGDMSLLYDAVVWVVIARMSSGQLFPFADALVEEPGIGGTFAVDLPFTEGDVSIHVYGIKTKSAAARAAFANMTSRSASGVASLIATRTVPVEELGLSETRGLFLPEGVAQQETTGVPMDAIRISVQDENGNPVSGAGTIAGAGNYETGSQVSISFTPNEGVTFLGWKEDGVSGRRTDNPYTFIANGNRTFVAVVRVPRERHSLQLLFTANSSTQSATLQGGGSYEEGTEVHAIAPDVAGNSFAGWFEDSAGTSLISANSNYAVDMPNHDLQLYAKYIVNADQN